MEYWDLRTQILEFTHRWQFIIAAFLFGSLVGWGIGYILPAPYRADTSVYIGYNADLILRNPDDYKNWYLGQLEAFIISDPVLEQVIERLRLEDVYWLDVGIDDIRPELSTHWRNAGRWRLVAEWADQEGAFQLAQAWGDVVLSNVNQAILDASTLIKINTEFNAASIALVETNLRLQELSQVRSSLVKKQQGLNSVSTPDSLESLERWRLQSLAATLIDFNPVGIDLLAQLPPPEASASAYAPWIEQLIASAETRLALLDQQSVSLQSQTAELQARHQDVLNASHGFSAYLVVELYEGTTTAQPVRRSGPMALVGGLIGILGYAFWGLVRLPRSASQ